MKNKVKIIRLCILIIAIMMLGYRGKDQTGITIRKSDFSLTEAFWSLQAAIASVGFQVYLPGRPVDLALDT